MDAGFNGNSPRAPCFSTNGVISLPVYAYGQHHNFTAGPVQGYSAFRSVIPGSSLGARSSYYRADTQTHSYSQHFGGSDAVSSYLSVPLSPSGPLAPRTIARFPAHFYTNVHVQAPGTCSSHLASFSNLQVRHLSYGAMSNQQQSAPVFRYDCSTPVERANYLALSSWPSPIDFSTPSMAPITPMLAATPSSWTKSSFGNPSHSSTHFNTQNQPNATRSVYTQSYSPSDEILSSAPITHILASTSNNCWTQTGSFDSSHPQTCLNNTQNTTSSVSPKSIASFSPSTSSAPSDELSQTLNFDLSNVSPVSCVEHLKMLPGSLSSDLEDRLTDSNPATEFSSPDAIVDSPTLQLPETGPELELKQRRRVTKNPSRRSRVKFTSRQLEMLESLFNVNQSPAIKSRADIARRMNLAENQIKNWFKNQRRKVKVKNNTASLLIQFDRSSPPDSYNNSHISSIYDTVTHSFVSSSSPVQF